MLDASLFLYPKTLLHLVSITLWNKISFGWNLVVEKLSNQFADGDTLDLDAIIYLIGFQELGQLDKKFKKDHKLDLMHIAICKLLTPYGYYEFDFVDEDG